jgi:curved DNA-binding protein
MDFKDYYEILGVSPETPTDQIKRAYRKLARQYHPDVSKLPDSEKRFKEINEAWEVLQDPKKRKQYDQLRARGWQPEGHGFNPPPEGAYPQEGAEYFYGQDAAGNDFSDFFNAIFRERAQRSAGDQHRHFRSKGQDLNAKIQIPLVTAYTGGVQSVQLQIPTPLPNGRMEMQTKTLQIKIPAGVKQGSKIRLKGQGGQGIGNAPAADLYIEIEIEDHPHFVLQDKNIELKLPVTPWEAALGATITVPTLGGSVTLKIPANAQSGQKLRLKGRGLPGSPLGDQYVTLQIITPKAETDEAKALYQQMAKTMPFNPREKLGV